MYTNMWWYQKNTSKIPLGGYGKVVMRWAELLAVEIGLHALIAAGYRTLISPFALTIWEYGSDQCTGEKVMVSKARNRRNIPCSYVGNMEFSWNRVEFQLRWTLRICLRGECFLLGCLFSSWRQSFDVGFIGTWLSQYGLTLNVEHWVLNNDFSLFIPWFLDDKRRRPLRTSKTSEKTMQDFDFVLTLLLFRHDLRRLPTEFQSWWWPTSKRWLPYVIRKCRLNTDT